MNKLCKHQKVYENKMLFTYPPQVRWICKGCGESGTDVAVIQDDKPVYVKTYTGFEALDRMKTNWLQLVKIEKDPFNQLDFMYKRGEDGIIQKGIYKGEVGEMSIEGSDYKLSWFSENTFIDVDMDILDK
ncbi:TPA: hypothetical protein ACOQ39_006082 [Bacillus cereus]|uniref:hypothetical protein n=1 Tax=Bacillus cereus group TaxID=86661 RepID=UPI0019255522|nr:hypothetical protein [Bacillus cereus]MBL3881194.1 hypothetical protein [Bacillus cereus]HDR7981171.1 hypothetical protein [Bacillus cereus]HDR8058226.1 hypothetical protein [Bacillus cereus]HDR8074206.1 hypothetical protein [Bacillus cereus]HDR8219631.1 hypothetical protein [Bacillus cereus]